MPGRAESEADHIASVFAGLPASHPALAKQEEKNLVYKKNYVFLIKSIKIDYFLSYTFPLKCEADVPARISTITCSYSTY
jgi:hypothetical protein